MHNEIERLWSGQTLIAVIIHADYQNEGVHFFTPSDFSQQLAYMNRPVGYRIDPHVHNKVQREVHFTQEVLFIRKGRLKVTFYDQARNYLEEKILVTGDVILLAAGGHGFEMLEPTELIEVKQGPYAGEGDKTRFKG
jgi:mannose-6-phosphate isomerase-like protein (cupin superfamily)